jgi:hypothetical protein
LVGGGLREPYSRAAPIDPAATRRGHAPLDEGAAVGEPAALHLYRRHSQSPLGDAAIEAGATFRFHPALDAMADITVAGVHVTNL